ncbi:UDP-glycosyltransferase UGT5-like [Bactrocera neohumeralis]|uniref:UDP-glycosyltransferase UGT5-like n=1 Tax=Bactrocera neohumeralis TaxID=98809 RepID=UPI0021667C11|nr:UDP-glycosyltransferase UGT5-like [Bactrocera neohumeralis]
MHFLSVILIAPALLCAYNVQAYRFLGVLHSRIKSHNIVGTALLKELARRGHHVTVISPFPLKKPMDNYVDIETYQPTPIDSAGGHVLQSRASSRAESVLIFQAMGLNMTRTFLEESNLKALLAGNQTFDAVICEVFLAEALYGLSEHYNAPLIGLGTFGAYPWNTDMVGSPSPPSYVASAFLSFNERMTLWQRVCNFAFGMFERLSLDLYYLPKQAAIYKEYFPNNKRDMYEVRRSAALVLLNQHVSLSFSRPYVHNQIEVGGMHINRKRSPLPADLERFINESEHGVIYFSMGSYLRSEFLSLDKRKAILETFRGLKQRVLWKFENPKLEGKPDNVYISEWFPQDDILAHPNVKFFITHGGLLSTTESIYHGKPFIGIPIFADQFLNMNRAVTGGYGIRVDYDGFTKETFQSAIERMLNDESYTKRVADISAQYRDQPTNPLDLAVYWVEYVVRHKGARHLHCAGQDLNFIQYHSIDSMLIIFGGLSFVLLLILLLIRSVWDWLQFVLARKDIRKKTL